MSPSSLSVSLHSWKLHNSFLKVASYKIDNDVLTQNAERNKRPSVSLKHMDIIIITSEHPQKFCELRQTIFLASLFTIYLSSGFL